MEVEVPPYFLCPISLQIMRDPVTLPTGITYDRDNIERWIFSGGQKTCPATTQRLPEPLNLTPNHTLRRLTQSWCAANAFLGVERFPTPRSPVTEFQLSALLDKAASDPLPCLKTLSRLISDSPRNQRFIAASAAALDFLASVISSPAPSDSQDELAVAVLCSLQLPEQVFVSLFHRHSHILHSLTAIMRRSSNSRSHAIVLIKSFLGGGSQMLGIPEALFGEIVKILQDRISYQATKAAMQILSIMCLSGENTEKAAVAGVAEALVELLLDEAEKRVCEMALSVLDDLCRCRKGREAVARHAAGMAVVSKKMLRVTPVATERAVRIVYSIARGAAAPAVLREMVDVGVVAKLCLLVSSEKQGKGVRDMAAEILRMHCRFWRTLPCVLPSQLKVLNRT